MKKELVGVINSPKMSTSNFKLVELMEQELNGS